MACAKRKVPSSLTGEVACGVVHGLRHRNPGRVVHHGVGRQVLQALGGQVREVARLDRQAIAARRLDRERIRAGILAREVVDADHLGVRIVGQQTAREGDAVHAGRARDEHSHASVQSSDARQAKASAFTEARV